MRPVALSDEIAVGEMPTVDQIAVLAQAGFRSLLNVQPDGEVARLVATSEAASAAAAAGMAYGHIPVENRRLSDAQASAFAEAIRGLPRPIYACCYSGARAAAAWAFAVAPSMTPADIATACAAAGYDLSSLHADLARRHAGLPEDRPREPSLATLVAAPATAASSSPAPTQPSATPATPRSAVPKPATPLSAPAAVDAAAKIIFPRAAGAGGFAVSG